MKRYIVKFVELPRRQPMRRRFPGTRASVDIRASTEKPILQSP
jgi:hypothetical protein